MIWTMTPVGAMTMIINLENFLILLQLKRIMKIPKNYRLMVGECRYVNKPGYEAGKLVLLSDSEIYQYIIDGTCNLSSDWVVLPNYEVVEFQTWSGNTTALDSVDYCYVTFYLTSMII